MHGTLRFLYLSHLLYGIRVKIFIMNRYISKSYTRSKNTIYRAGAAVVSTITSYSEYSFATQIVILGIRIVSCTSERQVLYIYLTCE